MWKSNLLKNDHKEALDFALQKLQDSGLCKSVWIYGSCARLEEGFLSDIDLAVIVESDLSQESIRNLQTLVLPDDYHAPDVHLTVLKHDFSQMNNSFGRALQREAIQVC
ncbi:MAG: nucleotidyltransferase domain-containing protein [Coriobacteriales bacterium]|jgi:predicted nucleotidyltransferase|nr:nucleotidyltransferase domain-containing protein [Coriobacteriales bacterium]